MDPSTGRFTTQDSWMGRNTAPATLNKYLYGNANPANYTDPTGNFSIGGISASLSVRGILGAAQGASGGYSILKYSLGDHEEFSARDMGTAILLNRLPTKLVKAFKKKYKKKTGKDLLITCMAGNSFVSGTLVHTDQGLIPIEELNIGDKVRSFNEETGAVEYKEVVHLIQKEGEYELVSIKPKSSDVIEATLKHPFYINDQWIDAVDIQSTDLLTSLGGNAYIEAITRYQGNAAVYNLTVNDNHTYYVGVEGILVHNVGNDCIGSVGNIGQFFKTQFGIGLKNVSSGIGRQYHGQPIYKMSKSSGPLKKGDYFYLDPSEKNHIEVFDRNGKFKTVLNLDGTNNAGKSTLAKRRDIKKILK